MKVFFLVTMLMLLSAGASTQHSERRDDDTSHQYINQQKSEDIVHKIKFGEAMRRVYQHITNRKAKRIDSLEQETVKE